MRRNQHNQLRLLPPWIDHPHARELETVSAVLDSEPTIAAMAAQDLVAEEVDPSLGREGMTGDLAVRAAILKQMLNVSYEQLAFLLKDSTSYRRFCRIGVGMVPPSASALQDNIRRLRAETWEAINKVVVRFALERGVDRGNKVRIDCTVTETNIHEPDDAAQLWDVVRVVTRILGQARKAGFEVKFSRRTRRAKRRRMDVMNAKVAKARRAAYRDLVRVTEEVLDFAKAASVKLAACPAPEAIGFAEQLQRYGELGWRVVHQTRRRVLEGEAVPAEDKVLSIFEPHTDIIIKGSRKVEFGHKVCLAAGASSLVFDLVVEDGNPSDSRLVDRTLDRTTEVLGRVPRQVAMDGGFASKDNLKNAKARGVKDVCFSKGRGMAVTDMVKSAWVYKRLRRFRAGVEGVISFLKRVFGLDRCTWVGLDGFRRYAWASVVSCNLLVVARHLIG